MKDSARRYWESAVNERVGEYDTLRAARLYNRLLVEIRKRKEQKDLLRSTKERLRGRSRMVESWLVPSAGHEKG